ncbi:hypothetical protein COB21_06250 [Candidatus Aerophobetes bacterium]|uniref:Mur ligase central domain-containing protein n=1 Tax=Aerophobetes bacterium TaxID=2030807 RepID=A0A2A4WX96_UNCAE|nr:MAG: hypothetical protein COB21_06250 [Candidatus Aerophobetes bacterium]
MDYAKAINKLFSLTVRKNKTHSLAQVKRLLALCSNPEISVAAVHVAGTNGKGSVCYKLAHCLEEAGYKVGLFTSPHINSVRERIQINGKNIDEGEVMALLPPLFAIKEKHNLDLCFFDILTALAFLYFKEKGVDIAVIETGLGGRYDATNVINNPLVCAITSIGLDHTHILGSSLSEIAWAKAGIIKPHVPVVLGSSATLPAILECAAKKGAKVHRASFNEERVKEGDQIVRLMLQELTRQGFSIGEEATRQGLLKPVAYRFEEVQGCFLDGAHNLPALEYLFSRMRRSTHKRSLHVILALSQGKGEDLISFIAKNSATCHIWPHTHYKLIDPINLKKKYEQFSSSVFSYACQKDCLESAISASGAGALVATGSFYFLGEVKQLLLERKALSL